MNSRTDVNGTLSKHELQTRYSYSCLITKKPNKTFMLNTIVLKNYDRHLKKFCNNKCMTVIFNIQKSALKYTTFVSK